MIKSFLLGSKRYRVKLVEHDSSNLGRVFTPLGLIEIQKKWDGKLIPADSMMQTFFHELSHCLFDDAGRSDLSADEHLVQSIAVLLHSFWQSRKE